MSPARPKNRKRQAKTQQAGQPFSISLRAARDLTGTGKTDEALATLNQLATTTRNPTRRSKILLLVGESEAKLSRHTAAAAAYSKASAFARQALNLNLLLSAALGETRSLLRAFRTEDAKATAASLLAEIDQAQKDYEKILALTPAQLAANGGIQVPSQPPRQTVILTKIATAFLESGLTAEARTFLLKAIQLAPNGASRARQGLAKLALAADEPALAERYAREALLMGRFQAKTVAAWQFYLDARARQNLTPILEPDVLASLQTIAKGRIASAALYSITRVLRIHGDPAWKTIAQSAISSKASDSIIVTELEKLIQADAKLTASENPRLIAARALRLFRAKDTSAQEQVSHAKAYACYTLLASAEPNTQLITRITTERYGIAHTTSVRHAMSLGAIQARDFALARTWLLALLADLTPGTEAWGKATWALARMAEDLENNGEASVWYFELAENNVTPSRFRIQAMLKGFQQLAASGGAVDTRKISNTVSTILATVDDYKISLDAGRQLALAGSSFIDLKLQAANRGKALASVALQSATSPIAKLSILEYVARRQVWDIGDYASVLEKWDNLTIPERREFEAVSGSLWYEYIALVFKALAKKAREQEGLLLVSSILDQHRATPEGYAIIGTEYAEWLLKNDQKAKAFEYFEWIAKESPTHRRTAVAHYWIALRFLKQGQSREAKTSAKQIRQCFGGVPALLNEWKLDSAAILIADGSQTISQKSGIFYTKDFIIRAETKVSEDLNFL